MLKTELRKEFAQRRLQLEPGEQVSLSRQICRLFFHSFDLRGINALHIFLPIAKQREVYTWPLIYQVASEHPHIHITVPVSHFKTLQMETVLYQQQMEVKENKYGIPEPETRIPFPEDKLDLVLVPLLAFDMAGYRVGYGRGFYDRFFAKCQAHVQKIGLSFFEPVERITDTDAHDVKLDACITPNKVYTF